MDKKEFFAECSRHDWYYGYSDDNRVWSAGEAHRSKLQAIADSDPELKAIWEAFAGHYFTGKPWDTEQKPMPTKADFGIDE